MEECSAPQLILALLDSLEVAHSSVLPGVVGQWEQCLSIVLTLVLLKIGWLVKGLMSTT